MADQTAEWEFATMDTAQQQQQPPRADSAKAYVCRHNGCAKSFTRLEHLNRHALNHTAGQATCQRCRAHFKRPDLLARHMERHRQRDEEAGGIGTLNTRKRSWRQPDGKIVAKRPQTNPNTPPETDNAPLEENIVPDAPISPPVSNESSGIPVSELHADPGFDPGSFDGHDEGLSASLSSYIPPANTAAAFDCFWNSGLQAPGQVPFQEASEVAYDQVFQADTASSFNMPYTTALNYNWLFDMNMNMGDDPMDMSRPAPTQQQQQQQDHDAFIQPLDRSADAWRGFEEQCATPMQPLTHRGVLPSPSTSQQSSSQSNAAAMSSRRHPSTSTQSPQQPLDSVERQPQPITRASPMNQNIVVDIERPLSSLQRSPALPCIDECTRELILDLVDSLHPLDPTDQPITRDHKLLSLSSLQAYLDLFFTRFNVAYPLIHKPTFVASNEESLLILAMLLLGATYSSKGAHQLAVCIHDVMRPAIFVHAGFSTKPELWVLQTILLVECFGKSRAGQKQHDMSHLFHGLLINLIRRSDCQSAQPINPSDAESGHGDLEAVWQQWAQAEMKKRLALLCFLWDTQHAVLFCQSLCMMAFELRVRLPCSQPIWEAQTASEWRQQGANTPPEPHFLTTLKSYLTPSTSRPPTLNALSRVIILHGLMSIFWDMQRRDQTSLGVIPGEGVNDMDTWRDRISRAYEIWKIDFDTFCTALGTRYEGLRDTQSADDSFDPSFLQQAQQELAIFIASYNSVYHSAQVLLNADFLDLQIYAGARHILGRPVQRGDYLRSERVVKEWASADPSSKQTPCAPKAAWHAAAMLWESSQKLDGFDSAGLFHVPWCLYLATLTCWAFHHAGTSSGGGMRDMTSSEIVWDAKAEMEALLSGMAESRTPREVAMRQGRERTGGLVWMMANALERVRWGIVHAGVMVLRGLVPWRMINQYGSGI